MKSTPSRGTRSAAVLLSTVLAIGVLVPVSAAAAGERLAARANSQWLAKQLSPEGTLANPNGGALPDHGLMIDTLYAMHAAGNGDLAAPIVSYLDDQHHASDYFTWDGLVPDMGYDQVIVGGATAKVLVAAETAGRDPRNFGGYDMVAETKGAIMRAGPDKGRVSDYSKNPDLADSVSNNANMFGQAFGVIGLAGVGENDQLAIDTMLTQQCSEGFFRIFFGYVPTEETGDHVTPNGYKVSTCEEGKAFDQSTPDGDATGLALSALLAARRAGAQGLDEPIGRTVAWLKANQTASGGWGGGVGTEAPNTNSTGLIVQALAEAGGADAQVSAGTSYLISAQANAAADSGNSLSEHLGAIAYNPDSYVAARTNGITGVDTWIRASAQASLGLSRVGFYDLATGNIPDDPVRPPNANPPPNGNGTPPPVGNPPVSKKAGGKAPPPKSRKGLVVTPPASQAQPGSATPAGVLGTYLAGKLVDGDHLEVTESGATYVDYDATADLVLALRTLGEQPKAVDNASRFLLQPDSIKAYAHGAPYEKDTAAYAEPLAKLVVVAGFAGSKAVDELRADLTALRAGDGKFVDTGTYADTDESVARHAWTVLATAGAAPSAKPIALLLDRQCTDGTFPVALTTKDCARGDLAATAAAVIALNGVPTRTAPRDSLRRGHSAAAVPDSWAPARTDAIVRAATALNAAPDTDGVLHAKNDKDAVDVRLSSVVAAGRQAAGLDASATARTLGALLLADGGLPKPADDASDVMTSVAAAAGVAGRAWTSAAAAPVTPGLRLPLADVDTDQQTGLRAHTNAVNIPIWLLVAGFVLATMFGFGLRRFNTRKSAHHKGVAP